MDEHRFVHPDVVPDAGLAPARETQRLDPGRAGVAEFEVAIVRGKRDRKPVAQGSAAYRRFLAEGYGRTLI
jgi:hypothetical protein